MLNGLLDLPWWGLIIATLLLTHITIVSVTVFLHRAQAHRALELHPAVSHFFRFWLWLTTGMVTREWVAIHRKHHAKCETAADPHSPQIFGIGKVLREGAELYKYEAHNQETLERYGHGTPDDWLERHVYRHSTLGPTLMALIDLALFGVLGLTVWAVQMMWIPIWAAGVINGIGHYWGYRNFETKDAATNIVPWGILIGGEELHNNHHAFPSSAKLSSDKWWELDIGWGYIRLLQVFRLARVKKIAPTPHLEPGKQVIDLDTLRAVVLNRLYIMADFARTVALPVLREELQKADASRRTFLKRARSALIREEAVLKPQDKVRLENALELSQTLRTVYEYRAQLELLWSRTTASHDKLLAGLQDWCNQAEASGIQCLQDFSRSLRSYTLQPA